MISNRVNVRFKSEARFDRLVFNSETITVKEIIQHLVTKKKLDSDKKTDRIALFYDDDLTKEVNHAGIVDGSKRLIVVRRPDVQMNKQAIVMSSGPQNTAHTTVHQSANTHLLGEAPIELTYNPKTTMDRQKSAKERAKLFYDNLQRGKNITKTALANEPDIEFLEKSPVSRDSSPGEQMEKTPRKRKKPIM